MATQESAKPNREIGWFKLLLILILRLAEVMLYCFWKIAEYVLVYVVGAMLIINVLGTLFTPGIFDKHLVNIGGVILFSTVMSLIGQWKPLLIRKGEAVQAAKLAETHRKFQ